MVCTPDLGRAAGDLSLCPVGTWACDRACYDPSKYRCEGGKLELGPATATGTGTGTTETAAPETTSRVVPTTSPRRKTTSKGPKATTTKARKTATTRKTTTKRPTTKRRTTKSLTAARKSTSRPVPKATSKIPAPPPTTTKSGPAPTQTADLRIKNSCTSTLWFEARWMGKPLPGHASTITRALPGEYVDYVIPADGLDSTRFWGKFGCDDRGRNCLVGDSMGFYPGNECPPGGCNPPIDSLFEATWGCKPGTGCHAAKPTTWFDTTQVDGWTIPYRLRAFGETDRCDCKAGVCGFSGVDATRLTLDKCPTADDLSWSGRWATTTNGSNLSAVNLLAARNGVAVGCISPCKILTFAPPWGFGEKESAGGAATYMCCPTPDPNPATCRPETGCLLSPECNAGPVKDTQYVRTVNTLAPGIYAFSYDDEVGLHACPAGTVVYEFEFCPEGSGEYPMRV
ncbi:hypothetical protein DFJ74DRAFT_685725 [Hyaloraphidium curvatum]|nr:hypothetical protein DFJ74DRAFT_698127 [Hyaloraphidium curvatum]KAI9010050.1 hypothetical protein DFJ74DRAFT_685725 [Hyaloraphidium curvatum]